MEPVRTALTSLPTVILLRIFLLLPVDSRSLCCAVCRSWRAALLERSLWTRLDLTSVSSDFSARSRVLETKYAAFLRCISLRSCSSLASLRVDLRTITHATLLEVVVANSGALQELHMSNGYVGDRCVGTEDLEELLRAAPRLRICEADIYGTCGDVRRALRNEAPFGPLRVGHLTTFFDPEENNELVMFAAEVAAHGSLTELVLQSVDLYTLTALDALVTAALARRLHTFKLESCFLSQAAAPALFRLLGDNAVTTLACTAAAVLEDAVLGVLTEAMHANATVTTLEIDASSIIHNSAAGAALLAALTGHPSLKTLRVVSGPLCLDSNAIIGAALAALVAANAPALTHLDVSGFHLFDACVPPLFEALATNTHLQTLECGWHYVSDLCIANVLLPAVRANTGLRKLVMNPRDTPAFAEMMRLVRERSSEEEQPSRALATAPERT